MVITEAVLVASVFVLEFLVINYVVLDCYNWLSHIADVVVRVQWLLHRDWLRREAVRPCTLALELSLLNC